MSNKNYTIAIESGIGGGSATVFQNGKILGFTICCAASGKADGILGEISALLKRSGIKKKQIERVIHSEHPGSHTGLKIGASIAKGLKLSLNAEIESRDLFDSIQKYYSEQVAGNMLIVLPYNRTELVWKIYDKTGISVGSGRMNILKAAAPNLDSEIKKELKMLLPVSFVSDLEQVCEAFSSGTRFELEDLGENLSVYLGMENSPGSES